MHILISGLQVIEKGTRYRDIIIYFLETYPHFNVCRLDKMLIMMFIL